MNGENINAYIGLRNRIQNHYIYEYWIEATNMTWYEAMKKLFKQEAGKDDKDKRYRG